MLTYGIEAWGYRLQVQSLRQKLNRITRQCCIWITGTFPSSPTYETNHLAGIESIADRYKELLTRYAFHHPRAKLEHLVDRWAACNWQRLTYSLRTRPSRRTPPENAARSETTLATPDLWRLERRGTTLTISSPRSDLDTIATIPNRLLLKWGPFWARRKWLFRVMKRTQLSLLCQFLLEHWPARTHLYRIQKAESEACRLCAHPLENHEHLFQCPALLQARTHLWHRPKNLAEATQLIAKKQFLRSIPPFVAHVYQNWGLSHVHW